MLACAPSVIYARRAVALIFRHNFVVETQPKLLLYMAPPVGAAT
jgi:hypothetical protein